MKGSLPFPLFQCWKQINIHEAFATLLVAFRNALYTTLCIIFLGLALILILVVVVVVVVAVAIVVIIIAFVAVVAN